MKGIRTIINILIICFIIWPFLMIGLFHEITYAEPREWVKDDPFSMATLPIIKTMTQMFCVIGFAIWVKIAAVAYYIKKKQNEN